MPGRKEIQPKETMIPNPLDELTSGLRPRAVVVVAHPDDETLWCGGYILTHPEFFWRIVVLCRAADTNRAPKFRQVLHQLGAEGEMADLDDGPDQTPLQADQIRETIGPDSAGQSGDDQGLSDVAESGPESVEELVDEGQAFEAEVIDGVENAPDADVSEVHTKQVKEDDVPPEYIGQD